MRPALFLASARRGGHACPRQWRVSEVVSVTKLVYSPLGQDLALPLKLEGVLMFSVNLSTRGGDGYARVDEATGPARPRATVPAGRPVLAGRPALAVAT